MSMNTADIQKRIDAMPAAMTAKGLRAPDASFRLEANGAPVAVLSWWRGPTEWDRSYERVKGVAPAEILVEAETFIVGLPSAEQTKRATFLDALAKVVDLGNELGQDVGVLASEMKRLSENVIADQRAVRMAA